MRVWLVDDEKTGSAGRLEVLLRQLEARPDTELRLVRASPFQADFVASMRKLLPDLLDLLVIHESVWPENSAATEDMLGLGLGVVVVSAADRAGRFVPLAVTYPICFACANSDGDQLWLALLGAQAAQRRTAHWKNQVERLQKRLSDRIIIERAKGILVQRLKLSEEDAYKRLRLESRRQRQQIQVIAEWVVKTQFLFSPEANGIGTFPQEPAANDAETLPPPV